MTKMCLWSMGQEDEFYDEKMNELKYGGGIWNLLSSVLHFTEEQKKSIIGSRGGMLRQQENIASISACSQSRPSCTLRPSTIILDIHSFSL